MLSLVEGALLLVSLIFFYIVILSGISSIYFLFTILGSYMSVIVVFKTSLYQAGSIKPFGSLIGAIPAENLYIYRGICT
jgi:hypothetical protein